MPVEITQRTQSGSQRLIEDFMIAANVAAAQALISAKRPCVFRVHDQPDPEKAEGLHDLATAVGAKLARGQVLRPRHFNAVLAHVKNTPDEKMINEAVLRSQSKAVYSTDNIGHFGLALRDYAHFTSPIRRYADLLVHRALIDMLAGGKTSPRRAWRCRRGGYGRHMFSHFGNGSAGRGRRKTYHRQICGSAVFRPKRPGARRGHIGCHRIGCFHQPG